MTWNFRGGLIRCRPVRDACKVRVRRIAVPGDGAHGFDALGITLGASAPTELAARLGVRLARGGRPEVDGARQTGAGRVCTIGNVKEGLDQIAGAMGRGALAATALHNLVPRRCAEWDKGPRRRGGPAQAATPSTDDGTAPAVAQRSTRQRLPAGSPTGDFS